MEQHNKRVQSQRIASLSNPTVKSISAYLLVTKPVMVSLLVFTGVVGFFLASQGAIPAATFTLLLLSLTCGCAGANTLTGYIDRDIDAVMERTMGRPIPSSRIAPRKALAFGIVLVIIALSCALTLNWLTFVITLAGIINNVVIYSLWTKRRSSLNILLGGFAGGLPVLGGYAAYAGTIGASSLFLCAVVVVWTPVHIWSLALKYRGDYLEANVPMLPVVVSTKRAVQLIALSSGLLVVLSLVPVMLGFFGTVYLVNAAILGAVIFWLSMRLLLSPVEPRVWLVFKISNPYLGLLFLSVMVDTLISH
ncbi:MAG: protoheme IX farnesyltransferase [Dehalococcoidia bacterium]|nr:MAG: protoheme IX farnesyltransferase [Dehalococcoidia bacterium]